jgi:fused signal recognition particle receptor
MENMYMYIGFLVAVVFAIWGFAKKTPKIEQKEHPKSAAVQAKRSDSSQSYNTGLRSLRAKLQGALDKLMGDELPEEAVEELEDTLITADVGVDVTNQLIGVLKKNAKKDKKETDLRKLLANSLLEFLPENKPLVIGTQRPYIILVVGVNGSGKTTTIGKLAHRFKQEGHSVMLAAGDTFRAGAIEQLKVWAERTESEFVSATQGGDPGAVMYNAIESARAKQIDILICDTAGRLQAQQPLMDELQKVVKVMHKLVPDAPHEGLLVLDATIGQNALSQAKGFTKVAPISGVVLTKLDGSAKGGAVLAVQKELGLPVKLVGLGEKMEDLRDFDRQLFVDALVQLDN